MTGPILDSASTLLVPGLESDRVYLVLRAPTHRAFPDCWVFPGGRIESGDGTLPVAGAVSDGLRPALGAAARVLPPLSRILPASTSFDRCTPSPSDRRAMVAPDGSHA